MALGCNSAMPNVSGGVKGEGKKHGKPNPVHLLEQHLPNLWIFWGRDEGGGGEGEWPVCETTNYIMSAKPLWELDQLSVQMICDYPNFTHQRFLWVHFGKGCVFPCGEIIHLENMQPKWCGGWITLLVLQMLSSFKHHGSWSVCGAIKFVQLYCKPDSCITLLARWLAAWLWSCNTKRNKYWPEVFTVQKEESWKSLPLYKLYVHGGMENILQSSSLWIMLFYGLLHKQRTEPDPKSGSSGMESKQARWWLCFTEVMVGSWQKILAGNSGERVCLQQYLMLTLKLPYPVCLCCFWQPVPSHFISPS